MENFKIVKFPEFKEECCGKKCNIEKLKKITSDINYCFINEQKNFCIFCYNLNELRNLFNSDESYYNGFETKDNRYPFERYVNDFFGLDLRYVEKCIKVYKKFMCFNIVGDVADLNVRYVEWFQDFNKSKLFELLSVSNEQLKLDIQTKRLSSDMTVKQIREYVKALKGGEKEENKVLEEQTEDFEEREPFDVKKTYSVEYYEKYSKTELITIIGLFEKEVQRLMKKK